MTEFLLIQILVLLAVPSGIIGCVILLRSQYDLGVLFGLISCMLAVVGITLGVQTMHIEGIVWMAPLAVYFIGYGIYRLFEGMNI